MPINPLMLSQGGAGLAYGLQPPQQMVQALAQPPSEKRGPQYDRGAMNAGMMEALSPIQVESGGWGEAIAEALAAGLRGRSMRDMRQDEMNQETRTQKIEDESLDMQRQLQQAQLQRALTGDPTERWSDPFELGGAQVQRNELTNQHRAIVPRPPQPRATPSAAPDLPFGFEWE